MEAARWFTHPLSSSIWEEPSYFRSCFGTLATRPDERNKLFLSFLVNFSSDRHKFNIFLYKPWLNNSECKYLENFWKFCIALLEAARKFTHPYPSRKWEELSYFWFCFGTLAAKPDEKNKLSVIFLQISVLLITKYSIKDTAVGGTYKPENLNQNWN